MSLKISTPNDPIRLMIDYRTPFNDSCFQIYDNKLLKNIEANMVFNVLCKNDVGIYPHHHYHQNIQMK